MPSDMMPGPRPDRSNGAQRPRDRVFYPALTILISATVFAGFAFTYFGPMAGGSYPRAGLPLHLHAWSFFLWYLLLPFQAVLVARGRHTRHRTLGLISMALVAVMTFTGVLVLTVRIEEAVRTGAPQIWLLYGPLFLAILILFVGFYAAAIYMATRNRLEAHKRLIIVASAAGMAAGFSRVIMLLSGFHPLSIPAGSLGGGLFILLGMSWDWWSRGAVHPAYLVGLAALLLVEIPLLPQVNAGAVDWINQWLAMMGDHLGILYEPHPTVEF
jgi:hypothetical protein